MTRNSRLEYLASRNIPPKPLTRRELVKLMAKRLKRQLIEKGMIPDPSKRPPYYTFHWTYGEQTGKVRADTRSQAKAAIKKELGIKSGRLPQEVEISNAAQPAST